MGRLDFSSPKTFQKCRIVADYEVLKCFFQKRLIKTLQNNDFLRFLVVFGNSFYTRKSPKCGVPKYLQ